MQKQSENPGKPGTPANGIQTQPFSGKCFQIKEHQKMNCLPRGCLINYPSICPAKLTFSIRARIISCILGSQVFVCLSFFALIERVLQKEKSGSLSNAHNNSSMARPGFRPNDFCVYQFISITYKNLSNLWCHFFPRSLRCFFRFTQGI